MKKCKKTKEYLLMNLGVLMLSAGVYFFEIPNGFSVGGVSGLGTLLGRITPISAGLWIIMINAFLLIIGFLFLGKATGGKTVYCSLLYSLLTFGFEFLFPMNEPFSKEPLLELIYAMLLTGIGSALIFYHEASSGGTDIIAMIIRKYTHTDVGRSLLFADLFVVLGSFFVFGIETGLFSLLGLVARAFLIDGVIDNFYMFKYFIVITKEEKLITEFITEKLERSATVQTATGAYTGENRVMIHTVCKKAEAITLRKKIKEADPGAFIIITTSSEILGLGFRS